MKSQSIKSKLMLAVAGLIIGSGLLITLFETNRFSKSLQESAIVQGEHLCHTLALKALDGTLTNDSVSLRKLLNYQQLITPSLAYILIIRKDQVLAHTFPNGFPVKLLSANNPGDNHLLNIKRIITDKGDCYLDFAWPVFPGKPDVLRIGLSEKPYRSQIMKLWIQMDTFAAGVLLLAIAVSYFLIRRITRPLSALVEAAKNLDQGSLDFRAEPAGRDEIGRLTTAIHRMVRLNEEYTQRLEKNTRKLDQAHRQTKISFGIIKKIWEQDSLKGAFNYMFLEFREIVLCNRFIFLVFDSNRENLYAFCGGEIKIFKRADFVKTQPLLADLDDVTFIKKIAIDAGLVSDVLQAAPHLKTFPIHYENQLLGALLVPCPMGCQCDRRNLEVVNLVLKHSSRALRRAVSREEEMYDIRSHLDVTTEYCGIVGRDPKMQEIYKLIEDIARTDTTILIEGEI